MLKTEKVAHPLRREEDRREKPSVYAFDDFTAYLRAYCRYKKSRASGWSLRVWSRRLGIRGGGTLSNFIARRRNLKPHLLAKIRKDLELSRYETVYFDALLSANGGRGGLDPLWFRIRDWLISEEKKESAPLQK